MVLVANLQYGWTLFVLPIHQKFGWQLSIIQWAFTIFIWVQTWLVPLEGYAADRFGPAVTVFLGGVAAGVSWLLFSTAGTLPALYVAAAIGGLGVGAVTGAAYGNVLKWFTQRRGLATGLTAAGYGAGSALTIIPISAVIRTEGYEAAFFYFGLFQGLGVILLSLFMRAPEVSTLPMARRVVGHTPWQMLRTAPFWVMYLMFALMAATGLTVAAQLAPIAKAWGVADVQIAGVGVTALTFALALDRVTNGISRPLFGWISDKIGREETMALAFSLEACGIVALYLWGHDPLWFVILSGLVFLAWGEIYALFPATCADTYGPSFASANYGFLYTAKGAGALLVPFANHWVEGGGTWGGFLGMLAACDVLAAVLALLVLRPLRRRMGVRT